MKPARREQAGFTVTPRGRWALHTKRQARGRGLVCQQTPPAEDQAERPLGPPNLPGEMPRQQYFQGWCVCFSKKSGFF